MTEKPSGQPRLELQFLEQLINQYAVVAGDVLAVDPQLWAIHGIVPRDGEVIMAEFDRPEAAQAVLASLKPNRVASTHAALGKADPSMGVGGVIPRKERL